MITTSLATFSRSGQMTWFLYSFSFIFFSWISLPEIVYFHLWIFSLNGVGFCKNVKVFNRSQVHVSNVLIFTILSHGTNYSQSVMSLHKAGPHLVERRMLHFMFKTWKAIPNHSLPFKSRVRLIFKPWKK